MILNSSSILKTTIAILCLLYLLKAKCTNSSDFKYELKDSSDLLNYNGICSQFARRTCCSQSNFQQLSKKMTKIIGGNIGLSNSCKFRLTNALCGVCDGDLGERSSKLVCSNYCRQFYKDCKEDYFAFDNTNQLRACKEDDIVCSKLKDIVASGRTEAVCELFQLQVGDHSCWNGQVSGFVKGPAKKKIRVADKVKTRRSNDSIVWKVLKEYKHILIPLGLILVVVSIWMFKRTQRSYAMWKRQIRNL